MEVCKNGENRVDLWKNTKKQHSLVILIMKFEG
jgi:hypothetical protein